MQSPRRTPASRIPRVSHGAAVLPGCFSARSERGPRGWEDPRAWALSELLTLHGNAHGAHPGEGGRSLLERGSERTSSAPGTGADPPEPLPPGSSGPGLWGLCESRS